MAKFIVITKNKLYVIFSFISLGALILYLSIGYFSTKTTTTFIDNNISNKKELNIDFNGDGENEILQIEDESNKYIVKIKSKTSEYILKTSDESPYLNSISSTHPIKITAIDLSRDGIPEIIIRTFNNNTPINYIFAYQKDCYTNILTSNENILGIVNSQNTKTPSIITLASDKGDESIHSYIYNNKKFKDISFNKQSVPGLSSIQKFIDLVQSPYIPSELPDMFVDEINSSDVSILWSFDKDLNNYNFQSGYFIDIKWDKKGEIDTIDWILSFSEINKTASKPQEKEILLKLTTEKTENNTFKISSVKKVSL